MSHTLIRNIKTLVHAHSQRVNGLQMNDLPATDNAFLLLENDRIKDYGPSANAPERADTVINASGRFVLPAWCDSHTHLVFAGSREGEFADRIGGLSYEEIAERGGGILNSARRLQQTSEEELTEQALRRLEEVRGYGTGLIEIKSGYGLTTESELKMLRVIQKLKAHTDLTVKATFLGAHTLPTEYRQNRRGYLRLLFEEMLPKIADEGLADYIDVFCEKVAFTPGETAEIIEQGAKYGLHAKIHTNQFNSMGGIEVSTAHGAISVDHLEVINDAEINNLSRSNTIATLLPTAPFFLNDPFPPARRLLAADLPVALATDFNPGSSPSGRMPFVLSLACIKMRMTPAEAVNAATVNGAAALEADTDFGSITRGKKANLIITKPMPSLAYLPYAFGTDMTERVILEGK